ncbi:MAG: hypothetical protein DRO73_08135 [Candidatus Thorarchaeota archaeon]|nr:MAG: hypothetical protein DRO73_08135 [Candidatus Thorarchaeota archaeon]
MYLVYVDESGKPSMKHSSPLFVQAAFILLDSEWQSVDNAVNSLKAKWFPNLPPEDVEIHAYEVIQQKGVYRSLGREKSLKLLENVFELIAKINCTLIASVIHKRKLWKIKDREGVELWSHRLLFERVCKFLEKENNRRMSMNQPPEYGILLIDSVNTRYDNAVRRKYSEFFKHGTLYQTNEDLIENPLFVNSQYRNMSQLVDVVAHMVNRYTNLRGKPQEKWNDVDYVIERGFRVIQQRFDTDESGKLKGCGIKHFPDY